MMEDYLPFIEEDDISPTFTSFQEPHFQTADPQNVHQSISFRELLPNPGTTQILT